MCLSQPLLALHPVHLWLMSKAHAIANHSGNEDNEEKVEGIPQY